MNSISDYQLTDFLTHLSSKEPVPGGGGAGALMGAVSAALCAMVANLTSGKKKYAEYQEDIERIISECAVSVAALTELIELDGVVFEPLSRAYGIPKEDPRREEILEDALGAACSVPLDILKEMTGVIAVIEELAVKGSRLAVSDVGVAAAACRAALEGAVMNVYINTKLMKKRNEAERINREAEALVQAGVNRCEAIYHQITDELRGISCKN